MIDEYLKQMLVSDYKDPTYTIVISSLDTGEECDHETITVGLKQYNPSIYDLLKAFYIDVMDLHPNTEQDLMDINDEATHVVDMFLDSNSNNVVYNNRKLVLRSGLEYDNDQKIYRSVLNANIVDGLPNSVSKQKTFITTDETDIFAFNQHDDMYIPLYLKTEYNETLGQQILMITLMNHQRQNVFQNQNKIVLITNEKGYALYYPTALPAEIDRQDYIGEEIEQDHFYDANSYFYNDGIPRYLYYIKVDYPGTEQYESFSKEFKVYIEKGSRINGGSSNESI